MKTIQLLDQSLINKIAAGEVVERPASVVKELIENSLDAGASKIVVEIENGGIDLIRIIDDGIGMSAEDAKMSLRRHATSKLRTVEDLHNISTLGFRGEALAAISAVSQFRLVTRPSGEVGATEVVCKNGEVHCKTAARSEGTSIEVRGLFHSVPARKKFLKASSTEFRKIVDVVTHQALLTPQVAWKLVHNGKTVADYPVVQDWKDRVMAVLGKDLSKNIIEIHHQRASLVIDGFLVHPAMAKSNSKQQFLFVNKRPVGDYLINKAVREGYSHHIAHNVYPSFVIQFSIAPDLVDVNVHPRKSEVKFADTRSVFREVLRAVRNALGDIVQTPFLAGENMFNSALASSKTAKPSINYHLRPSATQVKQSFDFQKKIATPNRDLSDLGIYRIGLEEDSSGLEWKLLGQIHKSFLIVEAEDGLMIVDQHAVAEKILYERLLANLEAPKVQQLLVPLVLELSPQQLSLIHEQGEVLKAAGIEGEEFGGNSYRLTGVPHDLNATDLKAFFFELLDDIGDEEFGKMKSIEDRQKKLLKYAACRGAIKFNDPLTHEEQIQLLIDMKKHNIVACVHGRPAMIKMNWKDLGKSFHRC